MEKDIDFMAYVDETTPRELVFKMLLAAQRDKLKSLEEHVRLSNEHALLKIKLFGRSSEKIKKQKPDLHVFDEAKATPQVLEEDTPLVPEASALDAALGNVTTPQKEPKKKGRKPIPGCYQRHDIIHDLPDHQKQCACGCALSKIGEDVSEQLDVIPAQIYVKRHRRFKYACKVCQENVKIAPVQHQAIPKTMGAPGLLAHVAVMKFDDHLPLYRQSEIWARLGVEVSRATLSAWILKMGRAIEPIVRHLQRHVVQSGYVQADETVCQVLKTPGKSDTTQSYMWVYMTGNSPRPAVVYEYQESRKGGFAKEFLKGFQGVLQSDGYSGYTCVTEQTGITSQGCFAHARRKFADVWKVAKKEGIASKALEVIGKLYDIEVQIKDLTSDEKQNIREAQATPILDAFHGWLLEIRPQVQAKGLLDKAIQYTLNQWDSLTYYVQNGEVAIDNNAAERQIRPFAIGRKNWLFLGSPEGAHAAANLYSLIETAKLNDVNPERYLKFVLEHTIDANDPALMEKLMPWNANIENGYIKPSLNPKDSEKDLELNLKTQLETIKIQKNTS
jgi:transposase